MEQSSLTFDHYQPPLPAPVRKKPAMFKQLITLFIFSIAVIAGMKYAQQLTLSLLHAHEWISQVLTQVFTGQEAGNMIRGFIAILFIPVGVALIPTFLFWVVRRYWFPYFMNIVWIIWLFQAGAITAVVATRGFA